MTFHFQLTCGLVANGVRVTKTVGAQNSLTDSRNTSVIGVNPNTLFGSGKNIHCNILRDSKHEPDFLLNSMKKF